MAENDNRSVLQVTADADGKPSLQSLNEILRQIQMNSHKIEGRLGEATVRDDLEVMGALTVPVRTLPPTISEIGEGKIYFDNSERQFKASENGGPYVDLIGGAPALIDLSIYNVMDYGAAGNGIADDTTAVGLAVAAAVAGGGGIVYFPAGRFKVSSVATANNSKLIFRGAGSDSTVIVATSATADVFTFNYSIATGFIPTVVEEMRFEPNVPRTAGSYLKFTANPAGVTFNLRVLVRSCYFQGAFNAITFDNLQASIISQCLFTGVATNGIAVKLMTTAPFSADGGDNTIYACHFLDEGAQAATAIQAADGGAGLRVSNTKILGFNKSIELSTTAGRSSNDTHINDSSMESFRGIGVDILPTGSYSHIFIQDNDFAAGTVGAIAIRLTAAATGTMVDSIIAGNRITMNSVANARCIQLDGIAGCTIRGIFVYGNIFENVPLALEVGANITGTCKAWGNFISVGVTTAYSIGSVANFGMDFYAGYGIKSDYGGLGTGVIGAWISLHGGPKIPAIELVGAQADGAGVVPGLIDFVYDTNSAGHKRVAAIDAITAGATANQRGAGLFFFTKKNGSATLSIREVITDAGSVVIGDQAAALGTTATDGFLYIPTSAGAPTGVPTAQAGTVAMEYDTTNNNLYVYNGAWKKVLLA